MTTQAFTQRFPGRVNALISPIGISTPFVPTATNGHLHPVVNQVNAIWDTGATASVITKNAAQKLGLLPTGMSKVMGIHGEKDVAVYQINLYLPSNVAISNIRVTECEALVGNVDVLIGMDIIGEGDFAVTHNSSETFLSFNFPSSRKIDFVEELNREKAENSRPVSSYLSKKNRPSKKKRR